MFPHFAPLAEKYDGFLVDLWGVVHDGTSLYPGAKQCLEELNRLGKRVIFISNAPRRSTKAAAVLDTLGVSRELYETVITSGEVAYELLQSIPTPGKAYFFIGPERDADVLNGLDFKPVPLDQADFILNVGFGSEQDGINDVKNELEQAAKRELLMLCLNPDLEVVKINGNRYPCAGMIAKEYEALGGKVQYFGKPYPEIYGRCLSYLNLEKKQLLAIGDSLLTDIQGANIMEIDSLLIKGGILKDSHIPIGGILPNFTMDEWTW